MLSFIEYNENYLDESIISDLKKKFNEFHPHIKKDKKTLELNVSKIDKDGVLIHLDNFFQKIGKRIKPDLGQYSVFKLFDNNIVIINFPKKHNNLYEIIINFSFKE